jgi:predicted transcriptional regulator
MGPGDVEAGESTARRSFARTFSQTEGCVGQSRTTVTLALQALVDQGLIIARARSGLFISEQLQSTYLGARQRADATPEPGGVR